MADSRIVTVTVGKIVTVLTLNVNPTSGPGPLTITISGNLRDNIGDPIDGKAIQIWIDNTYTAFDAITGDDGFYSYTGTLYGPASHTVQTKFLGDAIYEGCTVHNGALVTDTVLPDLTPLALLAVGAIAIVLFTKKDSLKLL